MVKIAHFSDVHYRGIARHEEYAKSLEIFYAQLREKQPDIIINTGDTFHTKTQGITPEIIQKLADMFEQLALIAPTYTILGNHDGNITNTNRENLITPIHNAIKNPNAIILKDSGVFLIEDWKIALNVFSAFDKDNWNKVKPIEGYINIALYHGTITGCQYENKWKVPYGEQEVGFFENFDFAFLGDIHRHQFVANRPDKNGVEKPWIAYPGTLIQQNYGESLEKGFLFWDIKTQEDWNVDFIQIPNVAPFLTIPWQGSVEKVLEHIEETQGELKFLPGTRYRITSKTVIPQFQSRQLKTELKKFGASETTFKTDIISKMDSVSTSTGLQFSKKSLAEDPDAIIKLYQDYLNAHKETYFLEDAQFQKADNIIRNLLTQLNKNPEDYAARNVEWSIKELKFDNLFGYGEGNYIKFDQLENIIGIFGRNRVGKSSMIGALIYTLFNTTDRGPIKNAYIINDSKNYCYGMARIIVGGTDYIIERRTERTVPKKKRISFKDSSKSQTSVKLWKIKYNESGQEVKVLNNGVGKDDTDRLIRKLIGTSEDFLLTAFANQGGLNRFIENKATKRKEILNRFLELDVFEKLLSAAKDQYSSLNGMAKNYSSDIWSRSIAKLQKEIETSETELEKLSSSLLKLNQKRDELYLWITTHENQTATIERNSVKKLESLRQEREKEIESVQKTLSNNKKSLSEKKKRSRFIERQQKKSDIETLRSDLSLMQTIKTSLAELKSILELQTTELKTQQKAVKRLQQAPCGTQFPSCPFIKDGHQANDTIHAQQNTVKQLEQEFQRSQNIFDQYVAKNIESQIKTIEEFNAEHNLLNVSITSLQEGISQRKREVSILKKDLKSIDIKLKKANQFLTQLEGDEFLERKELHKKTVSDILALETKKSDVLMSLGANQQKQEKLLMEQEEGTALIKKLQIYESIQAAFSKNGIPAMILKSQLPAINREMAKVLDNLVDFTVTLESDVSANIMDVYFEDGKSKRVVELGSGMEKTICSLALRVALGNLSSLPRPDIFILDESFGALDEDSLQKGMELLSLFCSYFKTIFIITHVGQVKEIADKIIEIKSDGLESTIHF